MRFESKSKLSDNNSFERNRNDKLMAKTGDEYIQCLLNDIENNFFRQTISMFTEILVNHSDILIQHNYCKLNLSIRIEIRLKKIKFVNICNRIETRKS